MAVGTVTTTTAASFLPTVWSQYVSDATEATTILSDCVDRRFEQDMRMGRVLQINDLSNPAVRFKSADTSATWANITETNQQVTINRQAYTAFLVEDIAELQSNIDMRAKYTGKCGYSLMATVEGDATSGMASLPSAFSQLVGTLGSDVTDDDILRAVQFLNDGDVPEEDRFFYVSPATQISLLKMDKFTRNNYVGDGAAQRAVNKARVGEVYGAPVYRSSLANNNPSTANTSYSWFCQKQGVALIIQRKPVTHVDRVILEDGWGVLTTCIYQFVERLIAPSDLGGGTSTDRFNCGVRGA